MLRISDVRQIEIQTRTAEPSVSQPFPFEAEIALLKVKNYKSPDIDQISAELIQAGGETLCSAIHELISFV
jgi:hypothetical protein